MGDGEGPKDGVTGAVVQEVMLLTKVAGTAGQQKRGRSGLSLWRAMRMQQA